MKRFNQIAASLNSKELRKSIYYPVQVGGGLSGKKESYFASYAIETDDPFYKTLQYFEQQGTDYSDYFNCFYVARFLKLEKESRVLMKRYSELSKKLKLPMKDFKREKTKRHLRKN